MCEYCKNVFTTNDFKSLFEVPFSVTIDGKAEKLGEVSVGLVDEENNLEIVTFIRDLTFVSRVNIKYCPMCGQNLESLIELKS